MKINLSHAQNTYVEKIVKEGGNEFIHFLLSNTLQREDAHSWNYKDVEKFCHSSPKEWKLWLTAMEDKFKSLQDRKIWELVELPKGRDPVKCRWVYDIKSDGHKKAHLVAKGFSQ